MFSFHVSNNGNKSKRKKYHHYACYKVFFVFIHVNVHHMIFVTVLLRPISPWRHVHLSVPRSINSMICFNQSVCECVVFVYGVYLFCFYFNFWRFIVIQFQLRQHQIYVFVCVICVCLLVSVSGLFYLLRLCPSLANHYLICSTENCFICLFFFCVDFILRFYVGFSTSTILIICVYHSFQY